MEAGFQAGIFHILTPDKLSTKSGLTRQEYECVGVRILFKRPTLHVAYPESLSPRPSPLRKRNIYSRPFFFKRARS